MEITRTGTLRGRSCNSLPRNNLILGGNRLEGPEDNRSLACGAGSSIRKWCFSAEPSRSLPVDGTRLRQRARKVLSSQNSLRRDPRWILSQLALAGWTNPRGMPAADPWNWTGRARVSNFEGLEFPTSAPRIFVRLGPPVYFSLRGSGSLSLAIRASHEFLLRN
ncbi:hypothetical protein R1flu_001393 [Riccia fluitans]|uniref:Uncharacterized protein n=1 Tax=Riccia fluitans TaxID=41844 RepID=A0ABD1Y359_9MARC